MASDDLLSVLTQFHREVLRPDMERIVTESVRELRNDMNVGFDFIYKRLDTIEKEIEALKAGLLRLDCRPH